MCIRDRAYPIYQLVLISLYDYGQEQVSGGAPLEFLGLGNYQKLLGDQQFWGVFGQTVAFAAVCVVGTLLVGAFLAILATRVRTWVRMTLFLAALGAWSTPAVAGSTIWLFLFDANFGFVNEVLGIQGFSWTFDKWTAFGLVAAQVIWCSFPFVMVTLYAGIKAIPGEVVEAATLDGASRFRFLWQVLFPLVAPGLVATSVLSFIHAWNDFLFAKTFIISAVENQTLPLALQVFVKPDQNDWGAIMAGSTLMTIPVLIFFVLVQRRLVSGLAGAVKG